MRDPGPEIIQQIAADFHASGGTFMVEMASEQPLDAEFGIVYTLQENNKVLYATTETWDNQPNLIAKRGYIYIYCDYDKDDDGSRQPSGLRSAYRRFDSYRLYHLIFLYFTSFVLKSLTKPAVTKALVTIFLPFALSL